MFLFKILCLGIFNVLKVSIAQKGPYFLSDKFIDQINAAQHTWIAGRNFDKNTPEDFFYQLLGEDLTNATFRLKRQVYSPEIIASLPESYDPRERWPNCPSLNHIRNQGQCGSCWAHGAVGLMSDRYCISSNGKKQFTFSAQDMTSCGPFPNKGCLGGSAIVALEHWVTDGIVSGGDYESNEGCYPYELEPNHVLPYVETPKCKYACRDGYNNSYYRDKKYGKIVYCMDTEGDIMADLFINGPVGSSFTVYADFFDYKSGVYQHVSGKAIAGHAVRTIGWGVENGVKYWLVANSWGPSWGDKGFFKIIRGRDECRFETLCSCTSEPIL